MKPHAGAADRAPRKQSRPTRAQGKSGYRRLEAVLEAANIVVQRVEAENDIGRDAFIDIVDGTDVTGGVICVQIKSGKSFHHEGQWVVPGSPADFTLWRESTVPFFGIVHDAEDDALRWVDLSSAAVSLDPLSPAKTGPFGKPCIPVPTENRLDLDIKSFLEAAKVSLRRRSGSPAAALISEDVETVEAGIVDTFAVGRHDPSAFLLLGALFHRLPKQCRRLAVVTLALTTSHPNIYWTKQNWIPENAKRVVRRNSRWARVDVAALLGEIDEDGLDRGTLGQSVFHILLLDSDIQRKLFEVTVDRAVPDSTRFWAAAILLYLAGENAPNLLNDLIESDSNHGDEPGLFSLSRNLAEVDNFKHLIEAVSDFGYVSIF